jgi:phosphoglycerate dehydrogenase-like enzyme
MNIKIIEPIGESETAIGSRLKDLLERGGHRLFISDTRGLTDAELIQNVGDADILLLSNRPLSRAVIEACPKLKLISVAFTGIDHVDQVACKARGIILHNAGGLRCPCGQRVSHWSDDCPISPDRFGGRGGPLWR